MAFSFRNILKKSQLLFAIKLLLTFIAFAIVWQQVEWHKMHAALVNQQWHFFAFVCIFIMLQATLGGVRWFHILAAFAPKSLSLAQTLRYYFASLMFSIYTPGTFGSDMARVMLVRQYPIPLMHLLYSVVLDRIFSLIALIILMLLYTPTLSDLLHLPTDIVSMVVIFICFVGLATAIFARRIIVLLQSTRFLAPLGKALSPVVILLNHPLKIIYALMAGCIAHVLYCMSIYVLALSLHIDIRLVDCLTLVPFVMLLSSLPISIGGWGIREASLAGALALVGVSTESSVIIAMEMGVLSMLICMSGGAFYLTNKRT